MTSIDRLVHRPRISALVGVLVVTLLAPLLPTQAHRAAAQQSRRGDVHLVVSIAERTLWLVSGRDTLMRAPVAVGMARDFQYNGQKFNFATPRGTRRVLGKQKDPIWTPPDWHYLEKAVHQGLEPVRLEDGDVHVLGDGTMLEVRDGVVGRTNHFGNWWPWTEGMEIVFDGKIFIPPLRSPQRRVPDALGPRKLDMGDGYLIHGTHIHNEHSIGRAVSHGCVRMRNEDLLRLYDLVPVGARVVIR